jgi:hypothetical protein
VVSDAAVSDICETELDLAMIACDVLWVVEEALRLYPKYLTDSFTLNLYDNSNDAKVAWDIQQLCQAQGVRYTRVPLRIARKGKRLHEDALHHACADLMNRQAPVLGFLDHDIFPTRPTSLTELVEPCGFFGIGQRSSDGRIYLWPGFVFFRRDWLNGRQPDFDAIPGVDTGAKLADLVTHEEVAALPPIPYSYDWIRQTDGRSHSDAVERVGDFVHLANTTKWNRIPASGQRELLVRQLVAAL